MDGVKSIIKKAGESVLEKAVDAVLVAIYFNLEAPGMVNTSKRYQISDKVFEDLGNYNYQTLKRALVHLKQKGLLQALKESSTLPAITKTGEKKLRSIIPFYDEKRIWDGLVYLVSYDLPTAKNIQRGYLRNYLKKIGCGMLQQSMWLTLYNPTALLKKFISENNLESNLILISSLDKSGTIGGMTINELMENIYHLEALNRRYNEFILSVKRGNYSRGQLIIWFLSILKDDPQIPFSLVPSNWMGDKAYRLFSQLKGK